jgi:sulfide:quinone oxidoreductase
VSTGTSHHVDALRVVIAGGGVAALEALLALRRLAEERVSIELLAAEPQFWYRPLAVVEPFELGDMHGLDLSTVADELGAALILGALGSVDVDLSVARTASGGELEYDALLVATGARPLPAIPGALTFRGPADTEAFKALLHELESGSVQRIAFAVPGAVVWPLPLYELMLQTAALAARTNECEIVLVTYEEEPLGLFGSDVSAKIASLLDGRGIAVVTRSYAESFDDGLLRLRPEGVVPADRVVALPRLEGPGIAGLPSDPNGFIPTDRHGRVPGTSHVFAAGDATTFPVKQGGLATQQADAAAEAIAALAGAPVVPQPFRPVLRGLILTGDRPLFARAELTKAGEPFDASREALWWPPAKIAGRHLAPYLAEHSGTILTPHEPPESVRVDVELPVP